MTHGNGALYAIIDLLAGAIVGDLVYIFKADTVAVRWFGDIASSKESMVARHTKDYALVRVGIIDQDNHVQPDHTTIITGTAWAAAQEQPDAQLGQPQLLKHG